MPLKTLGARTFAAATFAAFTLHGAVTEPPTPPSGGGPATSGGMGLTRPHRAYAVQTDETYAKAVRQSRIKAEDEDLMVLVTAFLRVMT